MSRLNPGRIVLLGALTAFAPLCIDMYLPSLPAMQRSLNAPAASVQLTLSAFFAGLAIGQAFYGPLADRFGRKPPLYAGLTIFLLATLGCIYAPDVNTLVAFRFIQALGGCAGVVIARAAARDLAGGQELARVFSLLTLVMGAAPILAPLLGGYILLWFGWQEIFWFLGLFGLTCMVAVALYLPETWPPEKRGDGGIVHALRVYKQLLSEKRFVGYCLTTGFAMAALFVYITASSHLFIELYEVPPESFGWLFGANAAGLIGMSQVNRVLLRRYNFRQLLSVGVAFNLCMLLLLVAIALLGKGGLAVLFVPLFLAIASLGMIMPNAMACALQGEPAHAGSASALIGTAPFVAGAGAGAILATMPATSGLSMALVMAGCSAIAFVSHRLLARG